MHSLCSPKQQRHLGPYDGGMNSKIQLLFLVYKNLWININISRRIALRLKPKSGAGSFPLPSLELHQAAALLSVCLAALPACYFTHLTSQATGEGIRWCTLQLSAAVSRLLRSPVVCYLRLLHLTETKLLNISISSLSTSRSELGIFLPVFCISLASAWSHAHTRKTATKTFHQAP